ncbi:MAG: hypothetical protein KF722_12635 [Nitrospira sp.]|nr:hypothetical protein [Nitrospira sp.]
MEHLMLCQARVESAVRSQLMQQNPCPLDVLLARLPQFSWNEVFAVVDRLSRTGQLVLRHPERFSYEVSLGVLRGGAAD